MSELPLDSSNVEEAYLASVIVDPEQLDITMHSLNPQYFSVKIHQDLFKAMVVLREAGRPIGDPVALLTSLRSQGVEIDPQTLGALAGKGTSANAAYYASQVKRSAMLRRMVIIADEARAKASDPAGEPQEVAQWLRARLDDVGVNLDTEAVRIALGASELVDTLDAARTASAGRGVPSGMISIDEAAGNFMDGELTILAARPGVGKTALALQIADYTARQMRPVLFVSLEMTNRELVTRVIAAATRLDSRDIRACNLSTDDIKLIRAAKTDLDGVPLSLYSPPRANILDIRAMSRLQHAQDPLRMIVVDYIGLVRPTDWRRPRHEQVSQVSADLKALAKELSVPVLALCQLNREADGARPRLSHLRESGSIEQDADVVMFIHQEKGETELIIAKHRHGETGSVQMNWNPASVRFSDYGRWEPPPPDAEILQDSDRMGDWDRTGDLFE